VGSEHPVVSVAFGPDGAIGLSEISRSRELGVRETPPLPSDMPCRFH